MAVDNIAISETPFQQAGSEIAEHVFLQGAHNGKVSSTVLAAYVGNRLGTGTDFLEYLQTLTEAARKSGYDDIYKAVQGNLDEELGIFQGQIKLERTHAEWRGWFREDMKILLTGENFDAVLPEVDTYTKTLKTLAKRADVIEMSGALTGLEIMIAREYEQIFHGLEHQFGSQITTMGYTYIRSHAFHDHRHFREIFAPLQCICTTRQEVDRALAGLLQAKTAKVAFLDAMGRYRNQ